MAWGCLAVGLALVPAYGATSPAPSASVLSPVQVDFQRDVEPLLDKYCYDCHGNGIRKGKVVLDEFAPDEDMLSHHDLWLKVLKNVRAGLMPADNEPRPSSAEIATLERWIKFQAFKLDPANPDPGRVTVRRLNRVEYRETIRDLMGVGYDSEAEFPADDTGHGFDNLGEVLSSSPLLFEKYLQAASTVVDLAVPRQPTAPRERIASPRDFERADGSSGQDLKGKTGGTATHTFNVDRAGEYRLVFDATVRESFNFDATEAEFVLLVDGVERAKHAVVWDGPPIRFESTGHWEAGKHQLVLKLEPKLAGEGTGGTFVDLRIGSAKLTGPMAEEHWLPTKNYSRFFSRPAAPTTAEARETYAREALRTFASRAFRRPVDEKTVIRLAAIARDVYNEPGKRFEDGFARAAMAVLASPRFLFRLEEPLASDAGHGFARIDEYSLASRLSYFLWSSMPDEELIALAGRGELRSVLSAQVARMLQDPKSKAFVRNFAGQWLQARDIETVSINARVVLNDNGRRGVEAKTAFDGSMRRALRAETEMYFDYVMREDRSLLELIDSDYTFLNAKLAAFYELPLVVGDELRKVTLPSDSVRGGVLTQGSVLAVTSNPTRTSPVKRGLFVLENLIGQPPPPPPPDIPALEAAQHADGQELSLRAALAQHRDSPQCASCHLRMDPIGFALENFDAMGRWRETDAKESIDASGTLITGETFKDIRDLKRILANERRLDCYQGITEKFMTYALGRGLDYYDIYSVDEIVASLDRQQGRFSALLTGIIESAPFQKMRTVSPDSTESTVSAAPPALTSVVNVQPAHTP